MDHASKEALERESDRMTYSWRREIVAKEKVGESMTSSREQVDEAYTGSRPDLPGTAALKLLPGKKRKQVARAELGKRKINIVTKMAPKHSKS